MIDAITTSVLSTGVFAVAAFYLIKRFAPDGRQESNRYHAYYAASATLFGGFFLVFYHCRVEGVNAVLSSAF